MIYDGYIQRDTSYSKEDWLWYLYNKLGCKNLALSHTFEKDGELCWSRKVKYETLLHLDFKEHIFKDIYFTREMFIYKATHRTILDIEIMLDVDDSKRPLLDVEGESDYWFSSIHQKTISIVNELRRKGQGFVCYHTGNKGYHISFILPWLRQYRKHDREVIKEQILWYYGGDLLKKSEKVTIALENELHRKTGKPKKVKYRW